jgi:hypothetical protein
MDLFDVVTNQTAPPAAEEDIGPAERFGRTIFGGNRLGKEALMRFAKDVPGYAGKFNPAVSAICTAKDVYDFATAENDRQRNEAASQAIIDAIGCIPGYGGIAGLVDGGVALAKFAGYTDKYLNEHMADGVEALIGTKDDKLDDEYHGPVDPVA